MLSVTKFNNKNTMLGSILSDIAARMMSKGNDDDRVANFASRVADEIEKEGTPFATHDQDYLKNKKIAVMLAKRYIDDYKKMKSDNDNIICRNCPEAISENSFKEQQSSFNKDYSDDSTALSIIDSYQILLGRFPDKAGFDSFYSKITNHEFTIQEIENQIKQSAEYIASLSIKALLTLFS